MTLLPYLAAMLALSCYALMGPVAKKVGADMQPFTFMTIASILLVLISGAIAIAFERGNFSASIGKINISWLLVYVVANFFSYAAYLWAITRIPVAQFEMFGIFVPVLGGFFAWLILKEPFHARYFLALGFMAVGIAIAVGPELRSK